MRGIAWLLSMIAWTAAASPQDAANSGMDQVLRSVIADLRGNRESAEGRPVADPSLLPLLPANGVWAAPRPPSTDRFPPAVVSAKHLRHHVPKAAMKAYQNAEKQSKRQHPAEASAELERAIALDPEFSEAHGDLGVQYARLNRLADAEAELRLASALDPEDDLHYSNLGWVLFWQARGGEAEACARRALRIAPNSASAHMLLGRLLWNSSETRADGLRHLQYAAGIIPAAKAMLKELRSSAEALR